MPANKKLVITSWNACSIASREHLAELQKFAEINKPDVIAVQETFLKQHNKVYIPGYNCVRNDRESHGGGLATFVKYGLEYDVLKKLKLNIVEHLAIKLKNSDLIISNIYVPRDGAGVAADFRLIMNYRNHVCIGDFNAHHIYWTIDTNSIGRKLFNMLPLNGHNILFPSAPTYIHMNGTETTIDLVLYSAPFLADDVRVEEDLFSDHFAITIKIHLVSKTNAIALRRSFSRSAKTMLNLPRDFPTERLYEKLKMPLIEQQMLESKNKLLNRLAEKNIPNLDLLSNEIRLAWPNL